MVPKQKSSVASSGVLFSLIKQKATDPVVHSDEPAPPATEQSPQSESQVPEYIQIMHGIYEAKSK